MSRSFFLAKQSLLSPITIYGSIFLLIFFSNAALSFYCTDTFCAEQTASYNSPCQPVKNCTKIGFRKFLDPDRCNCCEYCFDYLKENDTCEPMSASKPMEMCGPRLTCVRGERETDPATCKPSELKDIDTVKAAPPDIPDPNNNFCMAKRDAYETAKEEGKLGIAQVYPECDADGFYAPRQCLPGSICYCSSLNGERIFGLATPQEYQDCACARDISRLQEFGFTGRFPHCLPNGDYDELQCVVRTCFCRSHPDEKFAMHQMNSSKCFNPKIHIFEPETPLYYMRDCELQRARMEVQIADAEMEGKKRIVGDIPNCDPDGNYAPIQKRFDKFFCANSTDGSQIEQFEARKFSNAAIDMNCHCARARALLWNSATGKPACCRNGNYREWQCVGSICFCVDAMGRQDPSKQQVTEDKYQDLECYRTSCPYD